MNIQRTQSGKSGGGRLLVYCEDDTGQIPAACIYDPNF